MFLIKAGSGGVARIGVVKRDSRNDDGLRTLEAGPPRADNAHTEEYRDREPQVPVFQSPLSAE